MTFRHWRVFSKLKRFVTPSVFRRPILCWWAMAANTMHWKQLLDIAGSQPIAAKWRVISWHSLHVLPRLDSEICVNIMCFKMTWLAPAVSARWQVAQVAALWRSDRPIWPTDTLCVSAKLRSPYKAYRLPHAIWERACRRGKLAKYNNGTASPAPVKIFLIFWVNIILCFCSRKPIVCIISELSWWRTQLLR